MLKNRIIKGVGANAYSQFVSIFIQLGTPAIFLRYWSIENYGLWLMLSSISVYVAMTDLGLLTTSCNKMTIFIAQNDYAKANAIFQRTLRGLNYIAFGIFIFGTICASISINVYKFDLNSMGVIFMLSFAVLISFYGNMAENIYKANGNYATGTYLNGSARLIEWVGYVVGLIVISDILGVAIFGAIFRLIFVLYTYVKVIKEEPKIAWKASKAENIDEDELKFSSLYIFMMSISNYLNIQGVLLVVGYLLGAKYVAIFSTCRTLSRSLIQMVAILSHAMAPEFSKMYSRRNKKELINLYGKTSIYTIMQSILVGSLMLQFAPKIISYWTGKDILYDEDVFFYLLMAAVVSGIWHVSRILLIAVEMHKRLSILTVSINILSLLLTYFLAPSSGIKGVAAIILVSEIVLATYSLYLANKSIRDF